MPASHGKQKQRAKHKKKREAARSKHPPRLALLDSSPRSLIRQAALLPVGPCFISAEVTDDGTMPPALITVVVTRKGPAGVVVPAIALVDRTCLGVKNAFVAPPMSESDLDGFIARVGEAHAKGMMRCDFLLAQSVVFHAVEYARSLGFEPHRDFPEPLFGPRPEALLDTPLARPERPIYIMGPHDAPERVIAQLDRAVGPGNYNALMEEMNGLLGEGDDEDDEDEDEEP